MKRILMAAFLAVVAGGLIGCSDDDEDTAPESAMVRVAHLSPDAPNVDVWVDSSKILTNVSFKAVSGYLELTEGAHQVAVTPTGATTPKVIDASVTLEGGKAYTVAATGLLASIQPLVLVDDLVPPASGQAKVRFVHTSPGAPAVDIAVRASAVVFSNVAFRGFDGYDALPTGLYDLDVRLAGTSTVALPVDDVSFTAGYNYTVFAVGLVSNGTLSALPVVDYQP